MKRYCLGLLLAMVAVVAAAHAPASTRVYQQPVAFVNDVFAGKAPDTRMLWITKAMQPRIRTILGHDLDVLRLRYWGRGGRTAWILEEIGKDKPITVGIVINRDKIELIKVLVFRESRGGEVRHPFFTDQFKGAALGRDSRLDRTIDGISGATLSVRALTRLARLALFLHRHSEFADDAP